MSAIQKPFDLRPEDIRYMTVGDNTRIRAWVKLTRDGCASEATSETYEPRTAVNAALEKALERWFDERIVLRYQSVSQNGKDAHAQTAVYACGQFARGSAEHRDLVKAVALSFVAAINAIA